MKRFHYDISVVLKKLRKLFPELYGGVEYHYYIIDKKNRFEYIIHIMEKDGVVLIYNSQLRNQKEVLKYLKNYYEKLLEKCSYSNK